MTEPLGSEKYEGPHTTLALTMKMLEGDAHREGWGKMPPFLYRISEVSPEDTDDIFGADIGSIDLESRHHYNASGFALVGRLHPDGVNSELAVIAEILESPLAAYIAQQWRKIDTACPIAHIIVAETLWHPKDEEFAELHARGLDLADMPNTTRARVCSAVIGDDEILLRREYGGKARWMLDMKRSSESDNSTVSSLSLLARIHRADADSWHKYVANK